MPFGGLKLPSRPEEIVDLQTDGYPMLPDLLRVWERAVSTYHDDILNAVTEAFAAEIEKFSWLTQAYIEGIIQRFVVNLDKAFNYWREEYRNLIQACII